MAGTQKMIDPDTCLAERFIALRAYEYWVQRGCPFDSPDIDWFKAIEDIRREMTQASGMTETEMAVTQQRR
jgi:hypothetical protein